MDIRLIKTLIHCYNKVSLSLKKIHIVSVKKFEKNPIIYNSFLSLIHCYHKVSVSLLKKIEFCSNSFKTNWQERNKCKAVQRPNFFNH